MTGVQTCALPILKFGYVNKNNYELRSIFSSRFYKIGKIKIPNDIITNWNTSEEYYSFIKNNGNLISK